MQADLTVATRSLDRIGARSKIRDFAFELSTLPNWTFMADRFDSSTSTHTPSPLTRVSHGSVAPQLQLDRPPPVPVHYDALDFVERAKLR
jgi:hypothetical protein